MPTQRELREHGRSIKKENKLMNGDEKSIWESTFDDLKGAPGLSCGAAHWESL